MVTGIGALSISVCNRDEIISVYASGTFTLNDGWTYTDLAGSTATSRPPHGCIDSMRLNRNRLSWYMTSAGAHSTSRSGFFVTGQNGPNPFYPETWIQCELRYQCTASDFNGGSLPNGNIFVVSGEPDNRDLFVGYKYDAVRMSITVSTTAGTLSVGSEYDANGNLVSALYQYCPNPFNPETWIPYKFAEASDVTISIDLSVAAAGGTAAGGTGNPYELFAAITIDDGGNSSERRLSARWFTVDDLGGGAAMTLSGDGSFSAGTPTKSTPDDTGRFLQARFSAFHLGTWVQHLRGHWVFTDFKMTNESNRV